MKFEQLENKHIMILGFGKTGENILKEIEEVDCQITVVADRISEEYLGDVRFTTTQVFLQNPNFFDIILKSPGIKPNHPALAYGQLIINDIELMFMYKQEHDLKTKIIAITGTNGKTSTVKFVHELLTNLNYKAEMAGNIGMSPLEAIKKIPEYIVVELSSFQLLNINEFMADYNLCITLSPDHLDYHETMEEYANAKLKLLENIADIQITYLDQSFSEYTNRPITLITEEITNFCEKTEFKQLQINKKNLPAIYCLAKALKISDEQLIESLVNFEGVEHRMEFVREINTITFINDSKATNVQATMAAISNFRYDKLTVIIGGYDKGENLQKMIDELMRVHRVLVIGTTIAPFANSAVGVICDTMEEALTNAYQNAQKNDIILLSPAFASYDQYQNYEERGNHFKELVAKIQE
ncbi:MAG: UDP-N-acetylmuramoyl-L-alanine--D-glutamate ligase [Mycoplasmatales bacterium]